MAKVTIDVHDTLADHLKLWKDTGVLAPRNELQSIQAWLQTLGRLGKEETLNLMRKRLLLLMEASIAIHEAGPEAEDEFGIYDEAPEMRPKNVDQS